ncbi:DUF2799 domain-containing protein [Undibacterium sp. Ren11W]|uniref:DUF2799 domain-containing protein n=1 Tax=Undibacterium sp. Ren11W TaxID=3413045 RepID=UPI003BEF5DEA
MSSSMSSSMSSFFRSYFQPLVFSALTIFTAASLTACQSTRIQVNDCKAGDWGVIGNKDGDQGLDQRFEERKKFCANVDEGKIKADSGASYQAGWEQGNFQYWKRLGAQDGLAAKAMSSFADQAASEQTKKNNTPLHQLAYKQGWISGNADYWRGLGDQDGAAGRAASGETARAAEGQAIGFNRLSYLEGWQTGNQAYWTRLGYLDAHDGKPDAGFKQHASGARENGVQVNEAAYRSAWNLEIIEYWKRLGWEDATQGRDVNTRRADAKQRGLKFSEQEYKQSWEQRLIQYWQDAGKEDGYGRPNLLEDRMANARRNNVFVIAQTREVYQQAWTEQNARYCSVDNAFAFGRSNQGMAIEVCAGPQQNRVRHALASGQEYENVLRQQSYRNDELNRLADRRNSAEHRLAQLERETKRDQDDKNRVINAESANIDKRREQEKRELREFLRRSYDEFEDLRRWNFRYEQQLQQIKRDIYLN